MFTVDAKSSRELQAVLLGVKQANKEVQGNIRKYTRTELAPVWQKLLAEHASTRLQHRVLVSTARVKVSNQGVTVTSASSKRALSGGLRPSENWPAVEFGADRSKVTTYTAHSRKGTAYKVTRHTTRQLRPRNRKGWVVFPTADEYGPRLLSLWVQTVVRTFKDAFDGKGA